MTAWPWRGRRITRAHATRTGKRGDMRTPVKKARLRAAMDAVKAALDDAEHASAEYWAALRAASWAELCAMEAREWGAAARLRVVMDHIAVSNFVAARGEVDVIMESEK